MASNMREGKPLNAVAEADRRPPLHDNNTKFTAVNNASAGNAATVVLGGHKRAASGPIAASPQTAARPYDDWQDNSADHPNKRKRTPDPAGVLQHPNPYPRNHIQHNPQSPSPQLAHAPSHTIGSEPRVGREESLNPRHSSMEAVYSDRGAGGGGGGDEPRHTELRELRIAGDSPLPPGQDGGSEQKKRKRQFANRTKTGCKTCRSRKKKCDEGKPECSNCKRGGFVCAGYTNKIAWPKAAPANTTPAAVSTQSRLDTNSSQSTSPSPVGGPSVLPAQGYSLLTEDVHPASTRSPQQKPATRERPATMDQQRSATMDQQRSATMDQQRSATMDRSLTTSTPPPGGLRQPPQQTPLPQQQPREVARTPIFVTSGPLLPSPRAASPGPAAAYSNGESMTDKQKMLSGQWYHSSASELVAERDRCKQACYRFNNALMLNASKEEQWRLFVEALRPGGQYEGMPCGIIDKVDVETPFHCTYGTNISLGEGVRIGPGCTISDSAYVTIKARTCLDGDVKIYTTIRREDARKRMGAKGPESANPVVIEEDCWLGGNVTVLPGVTIGRGSVVGAGSVICNDVPPYTVAAGNPATILSGVYKYAP